MTRTAILLCSALGFFACDNQQPATDKPTGSTTETGSRGSSSPTPTPAVQASGSTEMPAQTTGTNAPVSPPSGTAATPAAGYPTDSQHLNDTASEGSSSGISVTVPVPATGVPGQRYTSNKQELTDTAMESLVVPVKQQPPVQMQVKRKKD